MYAIRLVNGKKKDIPLVTSQLWGFYTMGMHQARKNNDKVIVSIFVNPIQFGENEDLSTYPRDINSDKKLCESHGVDLIFTPSPEEMYQDKKAFVDILDLSNTLCGIRRPIHFKGVCTVVASCNYTI